MPAGTLTQPGDIWRPTSADCRDALRSDDCKTEARSTSGRSRRPPHLVSWAKWHSRYLEVVVRVSGLRVRLPSRLRSRSIRCGAMAAQDPVKILVGGSSPSTGACTNNGRRIHQVVDHAWKACGAERPGVRDLLLPRQVSLTGFWQGHLLEPWPLRCIDCPRVNAVKTPDL